MKRQILIGAALLILAQAHNVRACASLGEGELPPRVSQESAIIVWDAAHHREHFIRRATFETMSRDAGFLVPTPTIPALAEANDAAFTGFTELLRPKKVEEIQRTYRFSLFEYHVEETFYAGTSEMSDGADGNVTMLFAQHVAGYDAVVLAAEDVKGLGHWLKAHGYQSSPALLKWLDPYVKKRWKITAFKISKADESSAEFSSTPVRMSFDTPRPFFPYSEPQAPQPFNSAQRWLQIFFLAPQRMAGFEGESADASGWAGQVNFADRLSSDQQRDLSGWLTLPEETVSAASWLTVFDDHSSPRRAAVDVFFAPDSDQSQKLPSPSVHSRYLTITVPLVWPAMGVALIVAAFCSWHAERKKNVGDS